MSDYILEMKDICKQFPGVKALDGVNFSVRAGEIHCLVGENGAGKSTLMKVLSGIHPYGTYDGQVVLDGHVAKFHSVSESESHGLVIINQELELFPELTVYENIFFGHEIQKKITIDWNETITQASEYLRRVGLNINPNTPIKNLGVGQQQMVEIAKAISKNVKLLILDEPTAALNEVDCDKLFALLREFKSQGITSIMISHKLKEVLSIADTITVLRDGKTICSLNNREGDVSEGVLIKNMVGREIDSIYPTRSPACRKPDLVLETRNWRVWDHASNREILHGINIKLHRGEIIGLSGLIGSGRTEFALSLFGNTPGYTCSGELLLHGKAVTLGTAHAAIQSGLAYVSEDRKQKGLILQNDIKTNITDANLDGILTNGLLNLNEEIKVANEYMATLDIKAPSVNQNVVNLSGGNQQKVSIAKWLYVNPRVMILDEPTRGVDVGAKHEIHTLMNRLVEQGMSIILISSELLEVLGMSDRVYVMNEGRITGEFAGAAATEKSIMEAALRQA